jgi:cysteine desulfurase
VDAVQAPGRVPLPDAGHSLALSGHKAGGPKGAGALVLRMAAPLPPLIAGGGQEHGHRGGTEALPAIAGMAAALAEAVPRPDQAAIRDAMEQAAVAAGAVPLAAGAPRLPNTTCLALPGRRADLQVIALDLAGVAVSAGAACSSGRVGPSHVLAAMGAAEWAAQAIRISLPWNLPDDAAPRFAHAYAAMAARMTHAA